MQRGVGASSAELSWVVSGYALTFGLVLVASGRLGDDRGRKKMFLLALALFTLTSAAAGSRAERGDARRRPPAAGRGRRDAQPAGHRLHPAAVHGPRARAGVRAVRRRDRHLHRDRPAARRPAAAVGRRGRRLALGVLRQRPDRRRGPGPRRPPAARGTRRAAAERRPLDLVGARPARRRGRRAHVPAGALRAGPGERARGGCSGSPSSCCWRSSPGSAGPAARTGTRWSNFGLLRTRSYALGTSLGLLYFAGFTAIFFVVTLFLQNGRGYTPLEAGLALTPFALGSAVTSAIGGRLVSRLGKPLVVLGLLAVAVGLVAVDVVLRLDPAAGRLGDRRAAPARRHRQRLRHRAEPDPRARGGAPAGGRHRGRACCRPASASARRSASPRSARSSSASSPRRAATGRWPSAAGLIGAVAFVVLALLLGLADLALDRRRRRPPPAAERPTADEPAHPRPAPPRRGRRVDPARAGSPTRRGGRPSGRCDGDARGRRRARGAVAAVDGTGLPPARRTGAGTFQLVARADGHPPEVGWVAVPASGEVVRDVALGSTSPAAD